MTKPHKGKKNQAPKSNVIPMSARIDLTSAKGIPAIKALIEKHGPLTLAKLAQHVWPNPNRPPKPDDRQTLDGYLDMHQEEGKWKNTKGKTWRLLGQPDKPAQGTLDAPGMDVEYEDEEVAKLTLAWSQASQERKDAQDHEATCKAALNARFQKLLEEHGVRRYFTVKKASGAVDTITYKHTPGKDGPAFEKPPEAGDE